jgi:hypothetical protein
MKRILLLMEVTISDKDFNDIDGIRYEERIEDLIESKRIVEPLILWSRAIQSGTKKELRVSE